VAATGCRACRPRHRFRASAYEVQTASGQSFIIVEPVGAAPIVAVRDSTRLNVGGSSRGTIFYGGSLGLDLGIGLSDSGVLWFMTRGRDSQNLNVADGLFRTTVTLPAAP
jgi:hypothetical protein